MMRTQYLIGVDLGTSATKAALYRPDGTLVTEASAEVAISHPAPGVVEQEQEDFYRSAAATVQRVVAAAGIDAGEVAAIAFDSQMAGIGAVDEDFSPAIRFDSWLDMRCQPYIDHIAEHHGEQVTALTGCPPICAHAAKMLWWRHERPDDYGRIACFVTPAGFVAGRLAGLKGVDAFIDHTFLHFTGCSDGRAGTWSDVLCDALGVEPARLPRIVAPWDIVGAVTDQAARDFGLRPGTPVAAGCGDTAASALGSGIVRPGMMLDVAGTASVLAGCTDQFIADTRHRTLLVMRSAAPGLWHPLAFIGGGGLAVRWFCEQFAGGGELSDHAIDEIYERLEAEASAVPHGSDGLLFSPHLGGRICPADLARRGVWNGFSWGHTRAHFFRSILEGVAYEYASYLRILRELLPHFEPVEARVVGGGARSALWNRIKAETLGVPYQPLERPDIGTLGAALIAGRAVGLVGDLAEAAAAAARPGGPPTSPGAEGQKAYGPIIDRYIRWQAGTDRQ